MTQHPGALDVRPDDDLAADALRRALVNKLHRQGALDDPTIREAMRAVARHLFLPEFPVDAAYFDMPAYTVMDTDGEPLSGASQPAVVALMLHQLHVQPNQHVLEVGAGTAYQASILGHLTGPGGHVTTIDIDADIVAAARANLAAVRVSNVTVLHGDGALGHPPGAPYDRVIATAGVHHIPAAWAEQLAPTGRLVIPLRLRGSVARSVVFEHADGGRLIGRSSHGCGFMPMRDSPASDPVRTLALTADGAVRLRTYTDQIIATGLADVLSHPRRIRWTGVRLGGCESGEWLDLWLACSMPNAISSMHTHFEAVTSGMVIPPFVWGAMATFDDDNLAYIIHRPTSGQHVEIGVAAHGPDPDPLTTDLVDAIRAWNRDHRTSTVHIEQHPTGVQPAPGDGQFTVPGPHSDLTITWRR